MSTLDVVVILLGIVALGAAVGEAPGEVHDVLADLRQTHGVSFQ